MPTDKRSALPIGEGGRVHVLERREWRRPMCELCSELEQYPATFEIVIGFDLASGSVTQVSSVLVCDDHNLDPFGDPDAD